MFRERILPVIFKAAECITLFAAAVFIYFALPFIAMFVNEKIAQIHPALSFADTLPAFLPTYLAMAGIIIFPIVKIEKRIKRK